MEAFEHRRREAGAHLDDILERPALEIANQDRIEGSAGRSVAANHEIASLEDANFLPRGRPLARFLRAIAPLSDDAFEALLAHRFD
jgi:hypothetical protein